MKYLIFIFWVILCVSNVFAIEAKKNERVRIYGKDVLCLIDEERKYSIENLPFDRLKKINNKAINFGYLNGRVFLLLEIKSTTSLNHILELKNPMIDQVKLFEKTGKTWTKRIEQGDIYPFSKRKIKHRFYHFEILHEGTYLLEIEGRGDQTHLKVTLSPVEVQQETDYELYLISGYYFGLLFILICVSLFMFLLIPGKSSFTLVGYIISLTSVQLALTGYGTQYLWGDFPYFQNRIIMWSTCFMIIFMILFVQNFLHTASRTRKVHTLFNVYIGLIAVSFCLFFTGNTPLLYYTNAFLSISILLLSLSAIPVAIIAYRKKFKPARMILLANIGLFIGVLLFDLYNRGFLQESFFGEFGLYIGTTVQSVFLVIALLDSYCIFKDQSTQQIRKISQLFADINEKLHKEVTLRTHNLNNQKEQLQTTNQELISSINAAREIQTSLIRGEKTFLKTFEESFVIFSSKNIVSGDFYWTPQSSIATASNFKKNIIVVGATNQTGVPGAMIGVLAMRILDTIIFSEEEKELNHQKILTKIDQEYKAIFSDNKEQTKAEKMFLTGIDLAFCTIDKEEKTLQFSGAKMNLFLWNKHEIRILKGGDQSIGNFESQNSILTTQVSFSTGDVLYIFTDGVEKELQKNNKNSHSIFDVFSNQDSLQVQHQKLNHYFEELKQKGSQEDDLTIVGIKL